MKIDLLSVAKKPTCYEEKWYNLSESEPLIKKATDICKILLNGEYNFDEISYILTHVEDKVRDTLKGTKLENIISSR